MDICSQYLSTEKLDRAYLVHTNCADIKIIFVTDEIVRMRVSFDKEMAEESYVLMTTAWEDRMDKLFEGERTRVEAVEPNVTETEKAITFAGEKATLVIEKQPLCVKLYNAEGVELYSSVPGSPFTKDGNNRVTARTRMKEEDCYYGFGEKTGELNKNKAFIRERATDAMGYDAEKMDTLYKHIPFYIRLDRETKKAVGLFYHNLYESVFNMGAEKSNYWPRYTYWQADGGDIDLFFLCGDTLAKVVDNYTKLTGRPMLFPKRAFGYQGSSMYYPELEKDSDDAVIDFIDTVHEEGFPIDGFHLSSGYTSYNNKRCVFTWNTTRFKDPKGYFTAMNERHAQNVPNIKPGILEMHPWFKEFEEQDVFVKDSKDESKYAAGMWWGGVGAFWDFTKESAREIWKKYVKENLIQVGTNSIWNDNCEYDSLLDTESKCYFEGKGGTIAQLKPNMCNIMCKMSNDAVTENDPNARPYSVCRSGSSGIQRYAQTWCGDNYTSWKSLKYNIPIITGMGLSGQPNEGADIGGFAGPAPEEELFVRWVQQGIFQARFSIHSASNDNTVTEPWMFKDSADIIRDAIHFRYRLTPYLYSAAYEATKTGAPIMRALVYEFQDDEKVYDTSFDYMFGRDILVANVLEKGAKTRSVYLPKGTKWYRWDNNFECFEGGQTIEFPVDIKSIPMFLREGAIVPMATNKFMSMEGDHMTGLHLTVVPGERTYELYEDDGVTNDYKKGGYRKTTISMSGDSVVKLDFASEGEYADTVETVTVEMVKKERSPFWVALGGEKLEHYLNRKKFEAAESGWYYSQSKRAVLVKYPNPKKAVTLTVSFEDFDLIGM